MNKTKYLFQTFILLFLVSGFSLVEKNFALKKMAKDKVNKVVLEKDFELGGNDSNVIFKYLFDLAVGHDGQIYVPDAGVGALYAFSVNGNLLGKVGRSGKGPGEYQILRDIAISNEKLYVFDPGLFRISVFDLKNNSFEVIKTVPLRESPLGQRPARIWVSDKDDILISYESSYRLGNLDEKKYKNIYRLSNTTYKLSEEPILKVPDRQYLILKKSGGFSVNTNIPLARKPIIQFGINGKVFYGWNGKPKINIYNLKGELQNSFSIDYKLIEAPDEYINRLLKTEGFDISKLTDEAYEQIYNTFPVYDWFVVDDSNRIWVAINTEDIQNYSLCIYNKNGEFIAKTSLPKSVELHVINDDYAYGIKEGKYGVQTVVRYKIHGLGG